MSYLLTYLLTYEFNVQRRWTITGYIHPVLSSADLTVSLHCTRLKEARESSVI